MGILTDAFVATEEQMRAADLAMGPDTVFPALQSKNIDDLKLAMLDALVTRRGIADLERDPDVFANYSEERIVLVRDIGRERGMGDESEGPWISRFPDTLVLRLAELSPENVTHYGTAWAASEAWRDYRGRMPDDISGIIEYLRELCQLARLAVAEQKRMFMWVAL
jgi:hypothetical protein